MQSRGGWLKLMAVALETWIEKKDPFSLFKLTMQIQ